jgi:hypothetical protein
LLLLLLLLTRLLPNKLRLTRLLCGCQLSPQQSRPFCALALLGVGLSLPPHCRGQVRHLRRSI